MSELKKLWRFFNLSMKDYLLSTLNNQRGGSKGGSETSTTEYQYPAGYEEAYSELWNYLKGALKGGAEPYTGQRVAEIDPYQTQGLEGMAKGAEPYAGKLVAGMSDEEKQSLSKLGEYAGQETPELWGAASDEILKTLGGGYDPATSEYYSAYRDVAQKELEDSIKSLGEEAAGSGQYFSGGHDLAKGELSEDYLTNLALINAELSQKERDRMGEYLPYASEFGEKISEFPLEQASALQELGALPREIEQTELTANYEEFQRQIESAKDLFSAGMMTTEQKQAQLDTIYDMFLDQYNMDQDTVNQILSLLSGTSYSGSVVETEKEPGLFDYLALAAGIAEAGK